MMYAVNLGQENMFRRELWHSVFEQLPVRITLDFEKKSYHVVNQTLRTIYADDMEPEDAQRMIQEWAEELMDEQDRKAFMENYRVEKLYAWRKRGQSCDAMTAKRKGREERSMRVVPAIGQGVAGLVAEFTFTEDGGEG